jgi:hypothetical protein
MDRMNIESKKQKKLKYSFVINLKLDNADNAYLIDANHKVINPDLPVGDYEPYMYVTFRSDRNNEGIKNARFGTYPEAYNRNAEEI